MSWRRFLKRRRWDRERSQELESYLEMETDDNLARGMPAADARSAAQRKLGNRTHIREEIYTMNTIRLVDSFTRNLRHSLRLLRRNPMFTAVALLTLAIGVGANTAVFSVVNSVLLKPLPYPHPEELVSLRQIAPGAAGLASFTDGLKLSPSMYLTYAENNRTFQSLGIWINGTANVTGLAEPEQVRGIVVSDGVLQALGVAPALGRWLSAEDQIPRGENPDYFFSGRSTAVMLSYGYWQRRFGGDPSVIGRTLMVDSLPREIVGVMPEGFRFLDADFDLLAPLAFDRSKLILAGFGYEGIGRLKPGVTIAQANEDMARMLPIWMDSWTNGPGSTGEIYEQWRIAPALRSLQEEIVGNADDVLWVVMATIGLVLLIACANVANLLLVRAEARQQALAVRAALGAGWGRILREMLFESVVLGLLGGVAGVALAAAGLELLAAIGPANLPRLAEIGIDGRTLVFSLAISVLAGLLFGLVPALKYARPRIAAALGSAGRTASTSRERHRTRDLLVIAQVAIALVLLVSAGLMIRSFQAMRNVDPGFTDPAHLQVFRMSIPSSLVAGAEQVTRVQQGVMDALAAIPGVTSAGFINEMPMEGFAPNWDNIFAEDKTYREGEIPPLRLYKYASPGFFRAAGTRLVAGREPTWTEIYGLHPVVMLSEGLARELWGSAEAAIGKRVREYYGVPWSEVVGVVQDVRENGVDAKAPETVYWPWIERNFFGGPDTSAPRSATFVVRSDRTGTESFLKDVRRAVWSVNSNLPLASVRTMQDIYGRSLARTSFTLVMLAIAGAMALVLGVIGIYGVIAYAVSQRRREIGIRLALGAQPGALRGMFVRHALLLALIGAAIGLAGAAGLTRLMTSLLFEVSPVDPATYAVVAAVLVGAALVASYLPARRAAAVDPVEALKAE